MSICMRIHSYRSQVDPCRVGEAIRSQNTENESTPGQNSVLEEKEEGGSRRGRVYPDNILLGLYEYISVFKLPPDPMTLSRSCMDAPASSRVIWLLLLASLITPTIGWIVPQPKANVWTTLAKSLRQDHNCLSLSSSTSPMLTCLVGIPFATGEFPRTILSRKAQANSLQAKVKYI